MFGKSIRLFRIFGFAVRIDLSWLIIAVLVAWSLAAGLFPHFYPMLSTGTHWAMGVVGALGLFTSIVLHELSHSLIARRHGLEMQGITLFIFGGVAEMDEEPPNPRAEFMVGIAGPIASLLIAGTAYGFGRLGILAVWPPAVLGVLWYLAWINLALALFNLLPAFPLDGGRVFRSILWHFQGKLERATRFTSQIGAGFGLVLVGLGILSAVTGNLIGGIWWVLLGLFLRGAAQASYQQLLMRQALQGRPIGRFLREDVKTAPASITLQQLVDDYILQEHLRAFPVADNGTLIGWVTTDAVKKIPREQWPHHWVEEVVEPCSEENTIDEQTDAMAALVKMSRTGASRMMVVEDGRLRGVVSLKEVMRTVSPQLEYEDEHYGSAN